MSHNVQIEDAEIAEQLLWAVLALYHVHGVVVCSSGHLLRVNTVL